ncbi:hypothetical protein [Streptomyces sp. NPDC002580]|uniref:hypothetical protein n=1 Tax=Streptomyces sp. NPDC002580 TaxID=3364653 RepID=UPI0036746A52
MTRDLYNVRPRPAEGAATALTDEEEQRFRAVLFSELGDKIADQGWARFPAHTPEDRRRLIEVGQRLTAHWGQRVFVEPEDECRFLLRLAGHEALPESAPKGPSAPAGPHGPSPVDSLRPDHRAPPAGVAPAALPQGA